MAKTCFVVMGYHKKTDYPTGRTLDMDKSYRLLIKPTLEECGVQCVRADEIVHSGVIDVPMYQHLLDADLVIADLSTSNPNALYELGVRHALRPFSTIVIAESKLQYPFDVAHTAIRSYQHLGEAIDYEEVIRFRTELKAAIMAILAKQEKDSPVYTYLPALRPPGLATGRGMGRGSTLRGAAPASEAPKSAAALMEEAAAALDREDFASARSLLAAAYAMRPKDRPWTSNDDYLVRQLAYATFMSGTPDPITAMKEAQDLLEILKPRTSNNPETLELWGGIAKGLWNGTHQASHMLDAVAAYERAFCLRNDYQSGTTLAFLLNVRASTSEPADAIADFVQARRIRRRIVDICTAAIRAEADGRSTTSPAADDSVTKSRYAVRAALAEAYLALDEKTESKRWQDEAFRLAVPQALKENTIQQLAALSTLLEQSPLRFLTT